MSSWLKEKGSALGAIAGMIAAFVAVLQVFVVSPMNHRFDAMETHLDQRVGDLTALTNQRIDNLTALTNQRIDDLMALMNQRIDDLMALMNQRFEAVDQRFDTQDQRFDAQDKRLDSLTNEVSELRKLTVGIIERVSRNEGEIDVIRQQLQTADKPSP